MKSTVQLNTSRLSQQVGITVFQFGTVPAAVNSYKLLTEIVPEGSSAREIF